MDRLSGRLNASHTALDLASGTSGSFPLPGCRLIRFDCQSPPRAVPGDFVQGDSHRLPFADRSFDAVVAAHCLEHFDDLAAALAEIKRVLKPRSALYVSVPDASTLTDRVYRWLYLGGGHVNAFTSAEEVTRLIEAHTGLRLRATRTLYSSLHFLARGRVRQLPRRRRYLFPGAPPVAISLLVASLAAIDRLFRSRLTVYGWEFHFDRQDFLGGVTLEEEYLVCSNCGSGHSAEWVRATHWPFFHCSSCRQANFYRARPA